MESPPIRNALISVSDKLGLGEFARSLTSAGVAIYSTGGTRRFLEAQNIEVRDVAAYTGFPEMMDGRLKTLHPKVFGGILSRHDRPDDLQAISEHQIESFELVVVNLYPFEATIARAGVTLDEAIEQIDIGGPSLVRAAAKNHAFVTIATQPEQYSSIIEEFQAGGRTSHTLRKQLAAAAFARTAAYDRAIADYFASELGDSAFAPELNLALRRKAVLRYGENPHQSAAVYQSAANCGPSVVTARQLNGKELSFNNLLDLDSALGIVRCFAEPAVVVIKHNNPCGAAAAEATCDALRKAMEGDPVSAFGSVLGFNRPVDAAEAEFLSQPGLFVEAILAPSFSAPAIDILTTKPKWRKNVRLMEVGALDQSGVGRQYRFVGGGLLVQDSDTGTDPEGEWRVATEKQPSDEQLAELRFGWGIARHVKSNAIVLSLDRATCGVGAGQMSRVDAVDIAISKAGDRARGSVLSSDAFFPFPDSIHKAAAAGIVAVIQPGGSKKDDDVVAACNEHGLPMIFTGRRHFKH
jgi:phosphoribosylaminoimidazolecarboxamide formyltransferase/IMP cyclohydrolase